MLVVAVLMLLLSPKAISGAFAIAMLTVGPGGAVLGWLLHRRWSAVAAGIALVVLAGGAAQNETHAEDAELASTVPHRVSSGCSPAISQVKVSMAVTEANGASVSSHSCT